ncbi:unnamed protein product [Blepharisma stoltei]|uniref:Uncharacterized protein n=1 Tax=Blepharisma stoltei TaxID=1481888 RepID=A0AAU9JM64_9CILI|nr:unnamed protein product [Blepharisma stoltei]
MIKKTHMQLPNFLKSLQSMIFLKLVTIEVSIIFSRIQNWILIQSQQLRERTIFWNNRFVKTEEIIYLSHSFSIATWVHAKY